MDPFFKTHRPADGHEQPFDRSREAGGELFFQREVGRFYFEVKALMQSKEELEKCIKEQAINKDAPKTDDLVDEVLSTWSFQN